MRIIAIALCAFLWCADGFSADHAITTSELARHLGVSIWRVPQEKLPDSYKVILYHVKGGKLTKEYLVGEFKKNGDLLICARWLSDSASISADDGVTIIATKAALSNRPVFAAENQFKGVGNPLLLCYEDPASTKVDERHKDPDNPPRTMEYSKAASGLAIVITSSQP